MKLEKLVKTTIRKNKRIGRGYGSGKGGHTATRGTKGQKSRGKVKDWFEGGQLALIRRLPKSRGKGKFKPLKPAPVIVNLRDLQAFAKDAEINQKTLVKAGIINAFEAKKYGVKILGAGEVINPLIIKLPISKQAAEKVKKAGGKVE